jgi:MFS family permease
MRWTTLTLGLGTASLVLARAAGKVAEPVLMPLVGSALGVSAIALSGDIVTARQRRRLTALEAAALLCSAAGLAGLSLLLLAYELLPDVPWRVGFLSSVALLIPGVITFVRRQRATTNAEQLANEEVYAEPALQNRSRQPDRTL